MKVVTRQEGGEVYVGESLTVTVLEVCGERVKLGFSKRVDCSESIDGDIFSRIQDGAGYYRYCKHGRRMLVLERAKGKWVTIDGAEQLVVVDVRRVGVTLALCSASERKHYESGKLPSVNARVTVLDA